MAREAPTLEPKSPFYAKTTRIHYFTHTKQLKMATQSTPVEETIKWRAASDVIEIEEETGDDDNRFLNSTPRKKIWRNYGSRHGEAVPPTPNKNNVDSIMNKSINGINNNWSTPKPKTSNMSLLSSTVAYATLERCLLGHLATMREVTDTDSVDDDKDDDEADSSGFIDYSKQCKAGHVIDLLELRRLSSRGVPDEPHELRSPKSSSSHQRKVIDGNHNHNHPHIAQTRSFGGMTPHRSYRPLVWRVLLGYLPPQTEQWNEVLARDRKFYANLVNELFESTCPSPHEVFNEKDLKQKREEEERQQLQQHVSNGDSKDSEATLTNYNGDKLPPPPPPSDTPNSKKHVMPGLLSARMQQEWVRDEEGNDSSKGRISPMCAMNTPRTRSRKTPLPVSLEVDSPSSTEAGEDDEGNQLASEVKASLLLPDNDGDNEANKFSIDDGEDCDGEDAATKDTVETSDTEEQLLMIDKNKIARSVSITKTSEEGVEAHIPLTPHEQADDADKEENLLLLDEIRKDVIRTHPDLRFFLEPNEDLGQKRYAALERILFVWAKLNKGVSLQNWGWGDRETLE